VTPRKWPPLRGVVLGCFSVVAPTNGADRAYGCACFSSAAALHLLRAASFMAAKQPRGELVPVGFSYQALDTRVADKVRSIAVRVREKVKKTLEDIIEIGNDLLAVKEALPHGQFVPWLKAEFGWGERMAQNFMGVAERFGAKSEIIADLNIQPTAAYLLAGPSVPDDARQKAVERAEAGEQITPAVAKEIVAAARKKDRQKRKREQDVDKLGEQLVKLLEHYRDRWDPKEFAKLACRLRDFADALDRPKAAGSRKGSS
jgi:Protein of unknown function (DUF3102)